MKIMMSKCSKCSESIFYVKNSIISSDGKKELLILDSKVYLNGNVLLTFEEAKIVADGSGNHIAHRCKDTQVKNEY